MSQFPSNSKPGKSLVSNVVTPTRPMFVPILPNAGAAAV